MWHLGEVGSDPGEKSHRGIHLGTTVVDWTGSRTVRLPVPSTIAADEILDILVIRFRTDRFADHQERFPVFTMR